MFIVCQSCQPSFPSDVSPWRFFFYLCPEEFDEQFLGRIFQSLQTIFIKFIQFYWFFNLENRSKAIKMTELNGKQNLYIPETLKLFQKRENQKEVCSPIFPTTTVFNKYSFWRVRYWSLTRFPFQGDVKRCRYILFLFFRIIKTIYEINWPKGKIVCFSFLSIWGKGHGPLYSTFTKEFVVPELCKQIFVTNWLCAALSYLL